MRHMWEEGWHLGLSIAWRGIHGQNTNGTLYLALVADISERHERIGQSKNNERTADILGLRKRDRGSAVDRSSGRGHESVRE